MSDASVSLGLDANQFDRELAAAGSKIQSLGKNMNSAMGALGAGLSIGGAVAGLKSLVEYGAHIADLSKTYGVSTDALQHFGNAAEKNGSSLEGLANGFKKMEGARSKALGGNQEMASAFLELGVGMQDLEKMNPEQIFLKIGGSSLNAAAALKVFGKGAMELRPLMRGLADGSIEVGDAIDKNMIAKLKAADDALKNAGQHGKVYAAKIIEGIEGVGESMGREYESIENLSRNAWQKAGNYFTNLFHGKIKAAIGDVKELANIAVTPDSITKIKAPPTTAAPAKKKRLSPEEQEHEDLLNTTLEGIKEKSKFTLGELASRDAYGESNSYRGKYIGKDIMAAQAAEREKSLAEDAAFGGRDVEAKQHMDRFESLTKGIGSLKDSDKGVGGMADHVQSIEKSATAIAANTAKPYVNQ